MSKPLRVLVVGHTYVVGVNQAKLDALATGQSLDVAALVPKRWRAAQWGRRHVTEPATSRARLMPMKVWFSGRVGAYLFPPLRALRAVRRVRPDVVQVEAEAFGLVAFEAALWARRMRVPMVLFCWENVDRKLSWLRRAWTRFVLRTAGAVVAGSNGAAETVRGWGYRGRVVVAPQLGVEAPEPGGRRPARDGRPFVVGFAGRLAPEKGVDVLLDAVSQLRARGHDARALVVGAGPEKDALRAHAARLGIRDAVEWRGPVPHDEVSEHIADMDVLVLPSRSTAAWREQFGHVLIEAMAAGTPVIGSTSGAIPEVVGRPDLLFAEGDAAALAARLEPLVRDAGLREQLAEWGRARVAERYTHQRIASRLAELYREIVEAA